MVRAERMLWFLPIHTPPNLSKLRGSSEPLEVCPVLENSETGVWFIPRIYKDERLVLPPFEVRALRVLSAVGGTMVVLGR